jgi:hypothetical protein
MMGCLDFATSQFWISWQLVIYRQQRFPGIIEDQSIGQSHLSPHCVATEDHPWTKNWELAKRLVELSRVDD